MIIDLPQAVDAAGNNNAFRMLERDLNNVRTYCGAFAPELVATEYAHEMWKLYEAGELKSDTALTGRFVHDATFREAWACFELGDAARASELVDRLYHADSTDLQLNLQVGSAGVSYVRAIRKFPFGVRGYERLASMRVGASLVDLSTREVLWAKSASAQAIDEVRKSDLSYAQSGSGGLSPAPPRAGGGTRLLEPLIVALDHSCLNEIAGLKNPTSELLARWLWQRIESEITGLAAVCVAETASSQVIYDGRG